MNSKLLLLLCAGALVAMPACRYKKGKKEKEKTGMKKEETKKMHEKKSAK
jgi:hypothetical protein